MSYPLALPIEGLKEVEKATRAVIHGRKVTGLQSVGEMAGLPTKIGASCQKLARRS